MVRITISCTRQRTRCENCHAAARHFMAIFTARTLRVNWALASQIRTAMTSRGKRIVALLKTVNLVPTVLQLGLVAFFIYFGLFEDHLQFPGMASQDSIQYDASGKMIIRLPVSNANYVKLAIFAVLSVSAIVLFIKSIATIASEYKKRGKVSIQNAEEFLESYENKQFPFVLLLRPFGNDGNLYLPVQKKFAERLFSPSVDTVTVENLIASVGNQEPYQINTVAIVDPNCAILAPGPVYLAADHNWKKCVVKLVERCCGVIFVFPPSSTLTPGVSWELHTVGNMGKLPKTAAVFSLARPKGVSVDNVLKTLSSYITEEIPEEIEKENEIFLINFCSPVTIWYQHSKGRIWGNFATAYSDIYESATHKWLQQLRIGKGEENQSAKKPLRIRCR